jgi:hypothetical protein
MLSFLPALWWVWFEGNIPGVATLM